jgi:hypothetical protein
MSCFLKPSRKSKSRPPLSEKIAKLEVLRDHPRTPPDEAEAAKKAIARLQGLTPDDELAAARAGQERRGVQVKAGSV